MELVKEIKSKKTGFLFGSYRVEFPSQTINILTEVFFSSLKFRL